MFNKPILKPKNIDYLLGFSYFVKIGPVNMKRIETYFSDLEQAFWATALNLEKAGLNPKLVAEFVKWRTIFSLEKTLKELKQEKINFLNWHDENYPKLLKEISSPPFIIYYRGQLPLLGAERLAVVGPRQHSAYAEKIITELLPDVISAKIEIISGLASGVDTLAHETALKNKGKTLAVLGSGLDQKNIYPAANRCLAEKIINSGGTIISEFFPKMPPQKQNFPQRNRIISGLTKATLIIEAQEKSGALITANYALEQNREVLAVPGNIFSSFSCGSNNLIKLGAKVVTNAEDILEVFKTQSSPDGKSINRPKQKSLSVPNFLPKNDQEKIIYQIIQRATERAEVITADEIIKIAKKINSLDTATINSTLSMLEIGGVAKNEGMGYSLN